MTDSTTVTLPVESMALDRPPHTPSHHPEHAAREPSPSAWRTYALICILTAILAMHGSVLAQEPDAPAASTNTDNPSGQSVTALQDSTEPAVRRPTLSREPVRSEPFTPMAQPPVPRWLEEVRAQRRALQQQRRAAHQARHEALDPIGAAQREQRKDQILRRRQELRDRIEQGREHYLEQYDLSQGPWFAPLAPIQEGDGIDADPVGREDRTSHDGTTGDEDRPARVRPSDWNNLWYYNGW